MVAFALVDRALLPDLKRFRWNLDPNGYAYTNTARGQVPLHRYVCGLRRGEPFEPHHRNAEKLDNRHSNLQVLSPTQHKIAHGMRPRLPIVKGDDTTAHHPAWGRGLGSWITALRSAEPLPGTGQELLMAMRGPRPKNLPKVLIKEEVEALMRMPNLKCPSGLRDRALMMLMHRCGLRVSEAIGLHLRDVKWAQKQIHLRPEITKGRKEAVVYLDTQTVDMLERWLEARREFAAGKPHLFVVIRTGQSMGEPLSRKQVWQMVGRRARKAGIATRVGCHTLRHTYATELLQEGFSLREVQHLLRHSDIRTTVLYTHLFDADLAAKIAAR